MACSHNLLHRSRRPLAAAITGSVLLLSAGQVAAQQPGALEEVVVTAQFREQNLQSTPIAITAITGADMEARGITGLTDLDKVAPNVQLRPTGAEFGNAITAYIRGIGQSDTSFAFEPAVGIYVDDVYYATLYGSQLDLLDLERAEVLRGPQGTLFGKNSVGGAVRMITRKPDGTQGGFIEATVGSLDRQTFRGAFETTLIEDKAFMRLSALSEQRDGYQDIIDFACAHPGQAGSLPSELAGPVTAGADCDLGTYGGRDVEAMRLALRFLPTDRLEINLTGDIYNDDSEAPAISVLAIQQSGPLQQFNQNVNLPLYGVALDERFLTNDIYKTYATNSDPTLGSRLTRGAPVDSWGLNAVIDYELTPDMMLTSITNYRETEGEYSTDNDGSPLQVQNLQYLPTVEQFTQEFRLTGTALDQRLNYTTGLFYFKSEQELKGGVQNSLYGLAFYQDDAFETENYSVFLNLDYALTDRLSAVVGLRYTDEEKTYHFSHPPFLVVPEPVVSAYDRVDYRIAMTYAINDAMTAYGSVATGFRSGGFNPRPFNASQLTSFGPEELIAYELGLKSEFWDRRVRLNVAAFYSDYQDRIVTEQKIDAQGLPYEAPMNIGTADIDGFEAEFTIMPVSGLTISGAVGYANFTSPDLNGKNQTAVPDWTANLGIDYRFDLGSWGSVTPRIDWAYQSEVFYQADNDPIARTPGRTLADASIVWRPQAEDWSVTFAVTNLTDKEYMVQQFSYLPLGYGLLNGQPGRPREWSLSVKKEF